MIDSLSDGVHKVLVVLVSKLRQVILQLRVGDQQRFVVVSVHFQSHVVLASILAEKGDELAVGVDADSCSLVLTCTARRVHL